MTVDRTDVEFASPPPGLSAHTSFALDRIDGADGLYALRSKADDLRLFLLDPVAGGYDYRPRLTGGIRAEIGAADDADVRLFVVANPTEDGVFLNLRAPIVVNRDTGRAAQVILDDQDYPVRAPLG